MLKINQQNNLADTSHRNKRILKQTDIKLESTCF